MTDEQFEKLMKKLEDIERQMQAGTWMPQRTYPLQPQPVYYPQDPPRMPGPGHWWQATD